MKLIMNEKGAARGRICVRQTLQTLEISETWNTSVQHIGSIAYLRAAAHALAPGMLFSISAKKVNQGLISVTRVA